MSYDCSDKDERETPIQSWLLFCASVAKCLRFLRLAHCESQREYSVESSEAVQSSNGFVSQQADARRRIEISQSRLMDSLILEAESPEGFDPQRVSKCSDSLRIKRLRTIIRLNPSLEEQDGDFLRSEFLLYVRRQPALPEGGACTDAAQFMCHLKTRSRLQTD